MLWISATTSYASWIEKEHVNNISTCDHGSIFKVSIIYQHTMGKGYKLKYAGTQKISTNIYTYIVVLNN